MNQKISNDTELLELEKYIEELETNGLTILPPDVTGVAPELVDRAASALLNRFTELTGCPISLAQGPLKALEWPDGGRARFVAAENAPDPTQALIQQLLQIDRSFRDLAVNPKVDFLVDHMMGPQTRGQGSARRLSSANSFIKWRGEFGYGPDLGLHPDQGANPLPWGDTALTANVTWALTDYTHEAGALAYVPGSHKRNSWPTPGAAEEAVAAEAPRGSAIVFHGATWHGAFPKQTPGLRLNAVAYYRHISVLPQENLRVTMADQPWEDCDNPELMRELLGFDDPFPYSEQGFPLPRVAS
ncbi:MAG: hypothetical protein GKR90_09935 [Pseudomonadales bacterium]|nr:hypothetical protein [Pseudomonadales bacterium]